MGKLIRKLFAKPYALNMELHNRYGCFVSIEHPSKTSVEGFRKFFEKNHFLVAHNMFDVEWDEKIILEEIFKKLLLIFEFNPNDKNIIVIYKNKNKIYLPNNRFVVLPDKGIFVYDKSKIKVFH